MQNKLSPSDMVELCRRNEPERICYLHPLVSVDRGSQESTFDISVSRVVHWGAASSCILLRAKMRQDHDIPKGTLHELPRRAKTLSLQLEAAKI